MTDLDAIVVGAGPNGLAAAIILAAAGLSVRVLEGAPAPGGGCRTAELTEPGALHDVCSTVHPLAVASPFFRWLGLREQGVTLVHPEICYAQPLDGGRAGAAYRSLEDTADALSEDGRAWQRTFAPLVERMEAIVPAVLSPLRSLPPHPVRAARFAPIALRSAAGLAERFSTPEARALLAGVCAHAMQPLDRLPSGAFGAMLATLAHGVGWPLVEGGSQGLVDAMLRVLAGLGGELVTGHWVSSLDELPSVRTVLLDLSPRQVAGIAGDALPRRFRAALRRFRYGPGVFKMDWLLSGPVPWAAEECRRSGTVHVGGTFEEIAAAEAEVGRGVHPERPYVLVVQPTVVDPTRAPDGRQVLWAYCHVPACSTVDMTAAIEAQIERFAPGFREIVVARTTMTAADEEEMHPNYVGGDINVGAATLRQSLFRPTLRWNTYATPNPAIFLCGSATPPGGGVHGMCGHHAARTVLGRRFGLRALPETLRHTPRVDNSAEIV